MTLEVNLNEMLNSKVFEQTTVELTHQSLPNMKIITEQNKPRSMNVSDYLVAFTTHHTVIVWDV